MIPRSWAYSRCADAAGFFQAVERGDVGMVQRRQHLRFALKAGHAIGVGGEKLRQDFERHIAPESRVRCGRSRCATNQRLRCYNLTS